MFLAMDAVSMTLNDWNMTIADEKSRLFQGLKYSMFVTDDIVALGDKRMKE